MKTWSDEIVINAPIEKVWAFMDGSEENLKIMDPKIVKNEVIYDSEYKKGSKSMQTYREGNKVMTYEVITKDYLDSPDYKMVHIYFELGGYFKINAKHVFERLSEDSTKVTYETSNEPIKLFAKIMMMLPGSGSKKMITKHLLHLKDVIENDKFNYQIDYENKEEYKTLAQVINSVKENKK